MSDRERAVVAAPSTIDCGIGGIGTGSSGTNSGWTWVGAAETCVWEGFYAADAGESAGWRSPSAAAAAAAAGVRV